MPRGVFVFEILKVLPNFSRLSAFASRIIELQQNRIRTFTGTYRNIFLTNQDEKFLANTMENLQIGLCVVYLSLAKIYSNVTKQSIFRWNHRINGIWITSEKGRQVDIIRQFNLALQFMDSGLWCGNCSFDFNILARESAKYFLLSLLQQFWWSCPVLMFLLYVASSIPFRYDDVLFPLPANGMTSSLFLNLSFGTRLFTRRNARQCSIHGCGMTMVVVTLKLNTSYDHSRPQCIWGFMRGEFLRTLWRRRS